MAGGEPHRIGDWTAQQVSSESELTAEPEPGPPLVTVPADEPYGSRVHARRFGPGSGSALWIGLVVALIPLLIGLAVLMAYLMLRSDDTTEATGSPDGGMAQALDPETGSAPAGPAVANGQGSAAEDEGATANDGGSAPSSGTADESPALVLVDQVEPSAEVGDEVIRMMGTMPGSAAGAYAVDLGDLAEVLGLELVDESTARPDAPLPPALPVSYPSAVVFAEGSEEGFEGRPHSMFEAIAGYMNRGASQLTIIGYADPADIDGEELSLHRAGHVKEHLVELGVEPARIVVVARDVSEAPVSDGPVDRRADLLFHIPS